MYLNSKTAISDIVTDPKPDITPDLEMESINYLQSDIEDELGANDEGFAEDTPATNGAMEELETIRTVETPDPMETSPAMEPTDSMQTSPAVESVTSPAFEPMETSPANEQTIASPINELIIDDLVAESETTSTAHGDIDPEYQQERKSIVDIESEDDIENLEESGGLKNNQDSKFNDLLSHSTDIFEFEGETARITKDANENTKEEEAENASSESSNEYYEEEKSNNEIHEHTNDNERSEIPKMSDVERPKTKETTQHSPGADLFSDSDEEFVSLPMAVILRIGGTEFLLVPFNDSYSHLVSLYDDNIIGQTIESFFGLIRAHEDLKEIHSFSIEDELVLRVPELNMVITEDNVYSREITIEDFVKTFISLTENTANRECIPKQLSLNITSQTRFITNFNDLSETIRSGLGFEKLSRKHKLEQIEEHVDKKRRVSFSDDLNESL